MRRLLGKELELLAGGIERNAKAYCLWTHRLWTVDQLVRLEDDKVLGRELELCDSFLRADERNFHCWDYRLAIAKRRQLTVEEEVEFTTAKVNANFSNYSAWHHRSRFLSAMAAPKKTGRGEEGKGGGGEEERGRDMKEVLESELQLVQDAVFTDPADQSPWIYLRWILSQARPPRALLVARIEWEEGEGGRIRGISLLCSQSIAGLEERLKVEVEEEGGKRSVLAGNWISCLSSQQVSGKLPDTSQGWRFQPRAAAARGVIVLSVKEEEEEDCRHRLLMQEGESVAELQVPSLLLSSRRRPQQKQEEDTELLATARSM
eukprot:766630-Hanusia_phi.AAC.1